MTASSPVLTTKILNATVVVTSLGMLVDFYDFIIFNMVRVTSLTDMGLSGDALTKAGLHIISWQAAGLLIGAYIWGAMGDKIGRKACVLGSILTYSLASIACAFVQSPEVYAAARFFAGVGIAGELGVGITMISERMVSNRRGYGVLVFLGLGFVGALLAALAAEILPWRTAYFVGGVAGLLVLLLRALLFETSLYQKIAEVDVKRGSLRLILSNVSLAKKYIANIILLIPVVFVVQVIWTLSPEFAKAFGITEPVIASRVMAIGYGSVIFGDMIAVWCSEYFRNRRKVIAFFQISSFMICGLYLFIAPQSLLLFYIFNGLIGLSFGIWMLGVMVGSEQFGTNIRSITTTTIPNFARSTAMIFTPILLITKESFGLINAAMLVGGTLVILSFLALYFISETYGKDLDYVER